MTMYKRRFIRTVARTGALLVALLIAAAALGVLLFPLDPATLEQEHSVLLTDRSGRVLRRILPPDEQDSQPVRLDEMSPWLPKALIAAEDQRFMSHPGVDPLALLRAVGQNLYGMRIISGASTLSTQVIRMTHPRPRTFRSKWIEMIQALQLERALGKERILERYLNLAPMGGNLQGVQAASRHYFGVDAADLTLAEAAMLMGIPQSPARHRPDRHFDRALERRAYVLDRMLKTGQITAAERDAAASAPLRIATPAPPFLAPHFCDFTLAARPAPLARAFTAPASEAHLATTLDGELQQRAEELAAQWSVRQRREGGADSMALVVLEVETGAVRAWVSAPDYAHPGFGRVNHGNAPRSAGSTLKPFLYALAFQDGWLMPGNLLSDASLRLRDYNPLNADRTTRGMVSAADALRESYNLPALRVLRTVGTDRFLSALRTLGIDTIPGAASRHGLALALGTADVRLIELANAYAALARGGIWRPWRVLETDPEGAVRPVFSPEAAWLVSDLLERPPPTGDSFAGPAPRLAWKTGTSNGRRDAWCVGYNPEYVVGVWMGNSRGFSSASLIGIGAAAPLVGAWFSQTYADGRSPWFGKPPGIKDVAVCVHSGQAAGPGCPLRRTSPVIAGLCPPGACNLCGPERAPAQQMAVSPLRIVFPKHNQTLLRLNEPEITLHLRAEWNPTAEAVPLFWYANGVPIARSTSRETVAWRAAPGTHTLACVAENGARDQISLRIE